ncbi:nickel pincer cofactor biosynthesis protein LarB [Lentisphaerota bacterium WC36G]|nr:nickel pincer cofactor biosynthesis protein LarB [Lentisphaerae bacterium WC36]
MAFHKHNSFDNFINNNSSTNSKQNNAEIDLSRDKRCGFSEVIYGESKTAEQIKEIISIMLDSGQKIILTTRVNAIKAELLLKDYPNAYYDKIAQTFTIGEVEKFYSGNEIIVMTAGTSDLPVAREALNTLHAFGIKGALINDVGVAGLHRLLNKIDSLNKAKVIIVVAGMEGALPSVVGGLVDAVIIAVPTSVGYGASLGGFTPLLTMLSSCASGITVTNIDNGFGAACAAKRIINNIC